MSKQQTPTDDPSQVPESEDDDADDAPPAAEKTPLDAAPQRRAKPRKPAKRRVVEREYDEDVPLGDGGGAVPEGVYRDDSPLNTIAAATQAMCEVSREGPGTGTGWIGRLFDHEDGRGPQPVYYGRIGSFARTRQILERVQSEAGGGHFRFATAGQPVAFETLDGPPKLSPSDQEMLARQRSRGGGHLQDESGFLGRTRNDGGNFPFLAGIGDDGPSGQLPPQDPIQDFDPDQGLAPEDLVRGQLNGWQLDGATGRLFYYAGGIRANPPPQQRRPPAHLIAAASSFAGSPGGAFGLGTFEPDAYLHGRREESKGDPEMKEILRALAANMAKPAVDPMASMVETLRLQIQGDKDKWERDNLAAERRASEDRAAAERKATAEKEAAERRADADKAEREARWKAESEERRHNFDLMIARLTSDKTTAETNQSNSVRIAEINAGAEKDKAAAAVASVEKMAAIQAASSDKLVAVLTSQAGKSDGVSVLTRGLELGANLASGKSAAGEISSAVKEVGGMLVDGYVAVKTTGVGGGGGAPGAQGQGPAAGPSDDDMIARFVTILVASFNKRVDPAIMPTVLGGACMAANFDVAKLDPILKIGSATIVGAFIQAAADKAVDEGNKRKLLEAKAAITSPEGVAWYSAVRSAFLAKQGVPPAPQQITTTPAPAPVKS